MTEPERKPLLHDRSQSVGSAGESPQNSSNSRTASTCHITRTEFGENLKKLGTNPDDSSEAFRAHFKKTADGRRVICAHCDRPQISHTAGSSNNRHPRMMSSVDSLIVTPGMTPRTNSNGPAAGAPAAGGEYPSGAITSADGGSPRPPLPSGTPPPAAYGINSGAAWDDVVNGKIYKQTHPPPTPDYSRGSSSAMPREESTPSASVSVEVTPRQAAPVRPASRTMTPVMPANSNNSSSTAAGRRGPSIEVPIPTEHSLNAGEREPLHATRDNSNLYGGPLANNNNNNGGQAPTRSPTSPGPPMFQPVAQQALPGHTPGYPGAAHPHAAHNMRHPGGYHTIGSPPPQQHLQAPPQSRLPSPTRPLPTPLLKTPGPSRFVQDTPGPQPRGRLRACALLLVGFFLIYGGAAIGIFFFVANHPGIAMGQHSCDGMHKQHIDIGGHGSSGSDSSQDGNDSYCSTMTLSQTGGFILATVFVGIVASILGARWTATGQFIRFAGTFDIDNLNACVRATPPQLHWSRVPQPEPTRGRLGQWEAERRADKFRLKNGRKELTKIFVDATKADRLFTEVATAAPQPPHLQPPTPNFPRFDAWDDRSTGFVEASDTQAVGFRVHIRRELCFSDDFTGATYESEYQHYLNNAPGAPMGVAAGGALIQLGPSWQVEEDYSLQNVTDTTFWGWTEGNQPRLLTQFSLYITAALGLFPLLVWTMGSRIGTGTLCVTKVIHRNPNNSGGENSGPPPLADPAVVRGGGRRGEYI